MAKRILIMGLPGAGKTTLAQELRLKLWEEGRTVSWLNADEVRKTYDDWDFSTEGRLRQSSRMKDLADQATTDYVIADFIAPLVEMRTNFKADWTVWLDTISEGRYTDTNNIFVPPDKFNYDFHVTEQNAKRWAEIIINTIL